MKIGIIGATGMAGSAVYREAIKRGHDVTALVRNPEKALKALGDDTRMIIKDAFALEKGDLAGFDVVVNAFSCDPKVAYLHLDLAAKLIALFRKQQNPRLFFILGAGSLQLADGQLVLDSLRSLPGSESWIDTPINQYKELQFLSMIDNVNWVGVSPSQTFEQGEETKPLLGRNRLLVSASGQSITSDKTMAAAIMNEIESPTIIRDRFTVCNA